MAQIEVSESELAAGKFVLKYDCVKDEYTRPLDAQSAQKGIHGWKAFAEKEGGIYRKVEPDWRAFLTSEGNTLGLIRWQIKHPYAVNVKRAEARMSGWATFRSGQLGAELVCGEKKCTIPLGNQPYLAAQKAERVWGLNREEAVETISVNDVGQADHTMLCIQFADLEPNQGLDHDLDDAQVFRTPLDAPNPENLVLEIEFESPMQPDNAAYNTSDKLEQLADEWYNKEVLGAEDTTEGSTELISEQKQQTIRNILTVASQLSIAQRVNVLAIIYRKYNVQFGDEIKKRYGFSQLVDALFVSPKVQEEPIRELNKQLEQQQQPVKKGVPGGEEEIVSKQILHLQMAQETKQPATTAQQQPASEAANSPLAASNIELNGFHSFVLKYDCARDQYRRPFNVGGTKLIDGWQSLVQSAVGVARLTEKNQGEFAYIGSNAKRGELVWRVEHPGARVVRVQLLISGMSTPDEMGDEMAKIGVDLVCGEHSSQRRPDAIPFNAQRVDLMEMEKVGPADFTEVRVAFERNGPGGNPSQLFRALFGEAATADDFVIRIDFVQPMAQAMDDSQQMALANELKEAVGQLKTTSNAVDANLLVQKIVLILGRVSVQMRKKLIVFVKQLFGIDLESELKSALPAAEADDLIQNLFDPVQQQQQQQPQVEQVQAALHPSQKETSPPAPKQQPTLPSNIVGTTPAAAAAAVPIDLDKIAEQINRSIVRGGAAGGLMKMFKRKEKSDTEQILQLLLSVNYNTRQLIVELFKKRFEHENLVELIRKEVQEEPAKELILALLDNPATLDAINLHKAMAGLGTIESVLIEMLVTRNNAQIQAVKQAYNQLYGKHLETDLASDTSGSFRTLLQSLCAANRDESMVVKQPKAEQDARSLYAGSEQKLGTDTDTFIALLAHDNVFQLRALDGEYNRLVGHHLDETVQKVFAGDVRDGLASIVRFARNPSRLFAEWINEAIKANKEGDAIRLLTAHPTANYNLASIGAEFHTLYGYSLAQALADTKFTTKAALASIVNRGGVL